MVRAPICRSVPPSGRTFSDAALVGPAFIELTPDGQGSFRFIAVVGFIDARRAVLDDHPAVEFSWDGVDEGDQVSGRGWAQLEAHGSLRGHLFIHLW
jgi:hypothetical protein